MAKIVLKVQSDTTAALNGVKNIKSAYQELENQLSKIKVSEDFTTQLQELTKYYQQFTASIEAKTKLQEKEQQAQAKSVSSVETLRKGVANLITTLKTLEQQYPDKTFEETSTSAQKLFERVRELSQSYQENGKLTKEEQKELAQLSQTYKTLAADVATLKATNDKLKTADPFNGKIQESVAKLQGRYASLLSSTQNLEKYYKKGIFTPHIQNMQSAIQTLQQYNAKIQAGGQLEQSELDNLNNLVNGFNNVSAAVKTAAAENKNYHGSLQEIVAGFLKFQLSAMLIMKPLQLIRNAISSINETLVETENTVIEIKRVLNDSGVTNGEISDELYKIAINLGQTFENVSEIATNFAKTGMSWQDTLKATEAAVLALNVAELTAEQSSEGLIAIMQQFGYTASDLTYIIDVLNKTADHNAVTTDELLKGLQKTGSYAKAANLSLEDTVALITRLSEATAASGQQLGNAMKSLLAYSSKDSSLTTFASLSDDMAKVVAEYKRGAVSMLEVWEALGKQMNNLSAEQANLLMQWSDSSGLETELGAELYDIQDQLTGVYDTAGTYRKNFFIALLSNLDGVQEQIDEIGDSAGYTMKEQETYMQSYTAKVNALNSEWEYLITQQEEWLSFKKGLVEIGTWLLKLIEYTGGLRTTVLALGTILVALFGTQIFGALTKAGVALKTFFANLVAGFQAGASAAAAFQAALGWIALIGTALSLIIGGITNAVNKTREAEEEARQQAIDNWNAIKDEALALDELAEKYKTLTQTDEEYKEVEQGIVDLLGTKAIQLANLTKGTEEYRKKLEELTEEQRQYNREAAQAASNAAKKIFANQKYSGSDYIETGSQTTQTVQEVGDDRRSHYVTKIISSNTTEFGEILPILEAAGFQFEKTSGSQGARGYNVTTNKAKWKTSGDTFKDEEELDRLVKFLLDNGYGETSFYDSIVTARNERTNAISDYLTPVVQSMAYNAGNIDSNETFDELISKILTATGATEKWRAEIEGIVSSITGYKKVQNDLNEGLDATQKKLEYIREGWDDIVDKLKEYKDLQKQALDLEEKQLAVEEAKKALEDAKNGRGIMRYSEASGQFEWVQDEKAIASAEDNLQKAVDALNEYVAEQAWSEMLEEMKDGTATNEKILELLANWISKGTDSNPDWAKQYIEWIKETTGVDLGEVPSYDSGGIASGLGFMPKATAQPESVNNPELTRKILTPTSNSQFDRYVHDMGLMFETAQRYSQAPQMISTVGNTTTNTDNHSVTINGVNLTQEQSNQLLATLQMIGLVQNNK